MVNLWFSYWLSRGLLGAIVLLFSALCMGEKIIKSTKAGRPTSTQPIFVEPFKTLDLKRWQPQLHSFPGNGANMLPKNIRVANNSLTLLLSLNREAETKKAFNGAGMGSKRFFHYGYFEVRMKPSIAAGSVASFFLMNQWQAKAWEHQEIDIEFLGNKLNAMQMTTHHFSANGKNHRFAAETKDLGFDIRRDFHNYGILWLPDKVEWYVDGKFIHRETQYVPQVPLQIRLNHWPGDNSPGMNAWLGKVDKQALPTQATYDWIKVYPWQPKK